MIGDEQTGKQLPLWVPYMVVKGAFLRVAAITSSALGGMLRVHWDDGTSSLADPSEIVWLHDKVDVESFES